MLLTSALGGWFDVLGWRSLFPTHVQSPSAPKAMAIHVAAEAIARTVPGGVPIADGIRVMLARRSTSVAGVEILSTALSRRLFMGFAQGAFLTMWSIAAMALVGNLAFGLPGSQEMTWLAPIAGLGMMVSTIGLASCSESVAEAIATIIRRMPILGTKRWIRRLAQEIVVVNDRMKAIRHLGARRLLHSTLLFLGVWILETIETYFVLRILGIDASLIQAGRLESLVSVLRLAAFFMPAGLGVQEGGYVGLLTAMGLATGFSLIASFLVLKRIRDLVWIVGGYGLLLAYGIRASQRRISARTT